MEPNKETNGGGSVTLAKGDQVIAVGVGGVPAHAPLTDPGHDACRRSLQGVPGGLEVNHQTMMAAFRVDNAGMSGTRTGALLLLVLVSVVGACVPVHNLVADPDVDCLDTPDDVCLRIAEFGLRALDAEGPQRSSGPLQRISVIGLGQQVCPGPGYPNAIRCWTVFVPNDNRGAVEILERPDGSLAVQ